jgi:flagellar biosynthetic protein FlhB
MAEQEQDRSEQATPFKLREAKKRGQVPKSLEVNSWFVLASFLMVLFIWGNDMIREMAHVSRTVLSFAGKLNYTPDTLVLWLSEVFVAIALVVAPIIAVIAIVAVLMNFFQTGPIFSFHPLKPDFKKINPATGFKRIFSIRTVYETFKSLIKLALFGAIVYFFIINLLPVTMGFIHVDPDAYAFLMLEHIEDLIIQLVALLLFIALIDLVYSRRDFSDKMKMSRREVKDEVKRREGDPQVRAKMKELQREASKRAQSVSKVPDADVLITNPTHRAIAIKYERDRMAAPRVLSKGAGDLALKMREVARKHDVPIVENRTLARALFRKVEIDGEIPSMFFAEVAKILVGVYARRKVSTAF